MKYVFTATFTPIEGGEGYECRIPDIPHCVTTGRDIADAMAMIQDAASEMLLVYEDDHTPVPQAGKPGDVPVPDGGFTSLVMIDTDAFRRATDTRAVKKTVSVPAWMADQAERQGISLSQALQETLRARLGV